MRMLFASAGSQATVFAIASLAAAVRVRGHEVFMSANQDMVPAIVDLGFPAISVTDKPLREFVIHDRAGAPVSPPRAGDPAEELLFTGRWFGRLAAASLKPLFALARDWRPDLVVGSALSYVAPLLAAYLGVPYVRQAIDTTETAGIDPGAAEELQPELKDLGLDQLPEPDLSIEICPPGLLSAGTAPQQMMRWIPGNRQRQLDPWMYVRSERRVCVTLGSRVALMHNVGLLRDLASSIAAQDVEVVIAAPETVAGELRDELPGVRAGWFPLDVVVPTCDLIVHHGGGVTSMTALAAGVPQLILPDNAYAAIPARRLAELDAAAVLSAAGYTPEDLAASCRQLLSSPRFRRGAGELAGEIAALPSPAQVAGVLEKFGGPS